MAYCRLCIIIIGILTPSELLFKMQTLEHHKPEE